jgi:hypothetical protein
MTYQVLNTNMRIKRFYYEIFADAVEAAANNKEALFGPKEQRFYILLIFSLAQGLNVALLLFIVSALMRLNNIFLSINVFPGTYLDTATSGFISLVFPFLIINYFLVFHFKTYLKYTDKRSITTKGWALMIYFIGSASAFILYMVIGKWVFST